jgi:hypothetical protein
MACRRQQCHPGDGVSLEERFFCVRVDDELWWLSYSLGYLRFACSCGTGSGLPCSTSGQSFQETNQVRSCGVTPKASPGLMAWVAMCAGRPAAWGYSCHHFRARQGPLA